MINKKRHSDIIQEAASSNWLSTIPLIEFNYNLSKQEFWDAIRLRYNWPIPNLPSICACGDNFNIQHSMSCKKGGFITQRHNELWDITEKLRTEVCKDVEVEPVLIKLSGERFDRKTVNTEYQARLDSAQTVFG